MVSSQYSPKSKNGSLLCFFCCLGFRLCLLGRHLGLALAALFIAARGRGISKPSFLINKDRIIMPAFGTYTGGLRSNHSVLTELMGRDAKAILTGEKATLIPLR